MILTTTIKARLWGNQYKTLLAKGYVGNYGEWIDIKVEDLEDKSTKKVLAKCVECGNEREVMYSQYSPFCKSCSGEQLKGEKHHSWKGGSEKYKCIDCGTPISRPEYLRCRECFGKSNSRFNNYRWREDRENIVVRNGNMQRWADSVKISADYTCDFCGDKNSLKVAHHLNGVDNHRDEMYDHINGVCLCVECHKVFHGKYGYGKNTVSQYLEFKELANGNKE